MDYTNKAFSRSNRMICNEIDGVPALVDPYRRVLIRLNPVALEIWRMLDGKRPVAALIETLKTEFDIDEETLEKDVKSFLKDLARREMIQ